MLESLRGYLMLGARLSEGQREFEGAWNFGPDLDDVLTVAEVLTLMREEWPGVAWRTTDQAHPHETRLLGLDSAKARQKLKWTPTWKLEKAVRVTAEWYRAFIEGGVVETRAQLQRYMADSEANEAVSRHV